MGGEMPEIPCELMAVVTGVRMRDNRKRGGKRQRAGGESKGETGSHAFEFR